MGWIALWRIFGRGGLGQWRVSPLRGNASGTIHGALAAEGLIGAWGRDLPWPLSRIRSKVRLLRPSASLHRGPGRIHADCPDGADDPLKAPDLALGNLPDFIFAQATPVSQLTAQARRSGAREHSTYSTKLRVTRSSPPRLFRAETTNANITDTQSPDSESVLFYFYAVIFIRRPSRPVIGDHVS